MQKKVQKVLTKYGQQASTDLHAAVTALDTARNNYDEAVLARSQHHAMWKKVLSDAVQLWQTYAAQFVDQERKLQEQVSLHKESLIAAKQDLGEIQGCQTRSWRCTTHRIGRGGRGPRCQHLEPCGDQDHGDNARTCQILAIPPSGGRGHGRRRSTCCQKAKDDDQPMNAGLGTGSHFGQAG